MNSILLRNIVFVATADPQFQQTAIEAVLSQRYGVRLAPTLPVACEKLREGTCDLLLAIVDLDSEGRELLNALSGCRPGFPIIGVSSDSHDFYHGQHVLSLVSDYFIKPVTSESLVQSIQRVSRESRVGVTTALAA